VNVDLPQDPEDYVHRIGRTARAGQSGKAISLADEDYVFSLDAIQRLIGMKIPVEHADDALFAPGAASAKPIPERTERPAAPSAPTRVSSKVKEKETAASPSDRRHSTGAPEARPISEIETAAATPPPFEEIPVSLPSSDSLPATPAAETPASLLATDFWTREAFGLDVPQGGFGAEPPEPPPPVADPPAKRRRRRRGRRVASRVEAAAPA
jgi:ATP-dependent RNA helicase RhlB